MIEKTTLEELYQTNKLSVAQISKKLSVTEHKIRWWMNKYNIPARGRSEAAYIQHNKEFNIKPLKTKQDYMLYAMGLGLYWGEGNKVNEYSVRLGNTDPELIKVFVTFLRKICGVNKKDIKFGLQLFNDSDENMAISYWMKQLDCGRDSFHDKVVKIPQQGKGTYRRKSRYGVLQIYVNNKRLKQWIVESVRNYADVAQG